MHRKPLTMDGREVVSRNVTNRHRPTERPDPLGEILSDRGPGRCGDAECRGCRRLSASRVGAVEGAEVYSGNVIVGRLAQLLRRSLAVLATAFQATGSTDTRLSTFSDAHPPSPLKFDAS